MFIPLQQHGKDRCKSSIFGKTSVVKRMPNRRWTRTSPVNVALC